MDIAWEDGFTLSVRFDGSAVVLSGNREGLRSLAAQLNALAEAAPGSHIHYDENNSLEDGSVELIVERLASAPGED